MKLFLLGLISVLGFSALSVAQVPVSTPAPNVAVAAPAAPPQWAQDLIVNAQKLPVIGPVVSKVLLYLGILSAILTGLVAFVLSAVSALSSVLNMSGLGSFADKLSAFKDGKIMYWLKYLSMFNAQKPQPSLSDTVPAATANKAA